MNGAVKVPKHLSGILDVTEISETTVTGQIVCKCGCKTFGIRYFGENSRSNGEKFPAVGINEYNGKYAFVIKARCCNCGMEYELYDFSKHAYDGFICGDGVSVPDEELITAVADDERDFEIELSVEVDSEDQFREEMVENPPEGMSFTLDDRLNIWSWVVIDLTCAESSKKIHFVDEELA